MSGSAQHTSGTTSVYVPHIVTKYLIGKRCNPLNDRYDQMVQYTSSTTFSNLKSIISLNKTIRALELELRRYKK